MIIVASFIVGFAVMSISIILEKKGLAMPWIPLFALMVGMFWGNYLGGQ